MEFRNGKVVHETQYFADPFEAPACGAYGFSTTRDIVKPDYTYSAPIISQLLEVIDRLHGAIAPKRLPVRDPVDH
jgi:hypothetical protein